VLKTSQAALLSLDKYSRFGTNTMLHALNENRILIDGPDSDAARSRLAISWLLLLRWGALICQSLLVLAVYIFFKITTPLPLLILIISFGTGTNFVFHYFFQQKKRPIPGILFALVMFLDVILLTALLHATGGPMNPFTFLFLTHISLGAILMRPLWAWTLAFITILCYAALFFLPEPQLTVSLEMSAPDHPAHVFHMQHLSKQALSDDMALHLQGMWLAFVITVFFLVFFVNKIQKDMEGHQQTLAELETEKNRSEKLASLATLAAGAAHEFSTPLATIAVAAGEMLSTLKKQQPDPELIADTLLIREQVDRCREILYQMSADAGEHLAESLRVFTIYELCSEVLSWFPERVRRRIQIQCTIKDLAIRVPFRTWKRIIRGLIKNALDASDEKSPVLVTCRKDERYLYIEVRDQGEGMDEETLGRAIEPFFTTKEPGKGLGLGLFLAESAAERLGGTLSLSSTPGKGTTAVISFSLSQIQCN
jgi:two-component system, sensor histidine kinase RegB